MICRKCGHDAVKVINSRDHREGFETKRRRKCQACGHRWSTLEIPEELIKRKPTPKRQTSHNI